MKKISVFLVLVSVGFQLSAQYSFQNGQRFYKKPVTEPYAGFERFRIDNPEIIVQVPDSLVPGEWKSVEKLNTVFAGFGNYLIDVATYNYTNKRWVISIGDHYDILYDFSLKRVNEATSVRSYDVPSYSRKQKLTYKFGTQQQMPDSEIYETASSLSSNDFTRTSASAFRYDASGNLMGEYKKYGVGSEWDYLYTYDAQHRVSMIVVMYDNGSGMQDSSSMNLYEYNSAGAMTRSITKIYLPADMRWATSRQVDYTYNQQSLISHVKTWTYDNNLDLIPEADYAYSYTITGKIAQYDEVIYNDPDITKTRLLVFYGTDDHATIGFEYKWNGTAYESIASTKYLFSQAVTGIGTVHAEAAFPLFYPNPCRDQLVIDAKDLSQVRIFDLNGKLARTIDKPQDTHTIDVRDLQTGLYWLSADGAAPVKFFKE